jgi:uncharacterized protein (TIGR00251 family)
MCTGDAPSPSWIVAAARGIVLRVHVQPGASRAHVAGVHGDALKLRLRARPIEGAANRELAAVLAEALGVRPVQVEVVSGLHGRAKRVQVDGIDVATALARLGPFVDKGEAAD